VRGVTYQFPTFRALSLQLEAGGDEQDLELPPFVTAEEDGEWVLSKFVVGDESASIPACIVDRGYGSRLAFEDRDWQRLWHFANSKDRPSFMPSSLPPPQPEASPSAQPRILLIGCDAESERLLAALLGRAGYATAFVASAEDAAARFRDMPIDLVVSEWALPGMSGLDFCRRTRRDATLSRIPILFLTARVSSADVVAAFEAGADDYVTKPFVASELTARVFALIRRSRMMPHVARSR